MKWQSRAGGRRLYAAGKAAKPFYYQPMFEPPQADNTPYRKLTSDHVSTINVDGITVHDAFLCNRPPAC
jgi:hypothetical protein